MVGEYVGFTLKRKFIYGPGVDEPVCMIDVDSNKHCWYHYDALGSVVALSESGVIKECYEYDAFGETTIYNAAKTQTYNESQYGNPYMFTAGRMDTLASGSLEMRHYSN